MGNSGMMCFTRANQEIKYKPCNFDLEDAVFFRSDVLYQIRETMFHSVIQTLRRELKTRHAAEYFLCKIEVFG